MSAIYKIIFCRAIEDINTQREISACTEVLAGLKFNKNVIRQLFREELMRESVIYQDILQRGRQQGELAVIIR